MSELHAHCGKCGAYRTKKQGRCQKVGCPVPATAASIFVTLKWGAIIFGVIWLYSKFGH
jgi:hypothetical protein